MTGRSTKRALAGIAAAASVLLFATGAAADEPAIDTGDTAWMLVSTALVLMMTIPGVALFYAGMVRKKNVLATMMQSFSICAIVSVVWMVAGYSLAFGEGGAYLGDLSKLFLAGLGEAWDKPFVLGSGDAAVATTIPESVFLTFQMTFAIITAALVTGAVADRMKFSALVVFITLWSLVVYSPIAHWVWHPNGFMFGWGVLDFAGGTVVHINAGVAGLVAALVLGKRRGYGTENMAPYNLGLAVIGASMLWVGWFGFNAGSAVGAGARAGMAMLVTQVATAAAALGWMVMEWVTKGKPSVLGIISGAVAGLVAITPASGFVLPGPALLFGVIAGVLSFWASTSLKRMLGYDDSLDVFGVHGVAGIVGALLVGLFAYGPLSATPGAPEGVSGSVAQLILQAQGVVVTIIYVAVVTFILLKLVDLLIGLRVSEEEEVEGLDTALHGERLG
ncbi:ammonium transporter [Elioraea sp.]|uniref:ammonium transporter n=1 Tax=Elioraea sp. TaxID=2185103 RepID=UPI0021DE189E|nr:ammonium transporter [Elioraea sp.]GIX08306.1 MAG: ammonium transporter [Elioraea sp.]